MWPNCPVLSRPAANLLHGHHLPKARFRPRGSALSVQQIFSMRVR